MPRRGSWLGRAAGRLLAGVALAAGLVLPSRAATGGPDAFGYTWKDGAEPGVVFAWEDVSATATDITIDGDDVNFGFQPLSFAFPYYGQTYTQVAACSNGWLSLVDAVSTEYLNVALPAASPPDGTIAALWDDQACTVGVTRMLFADLGTRAVVTWENIHDYQDVTRRNVYQVILEADGRIRIQWQAVATDPASATAGIESPANDDGLTVFSDPPSGGPVAGGVVVFEPPSTIPIGLDCTTAAPLGCGDRVDGDLTLGTAGQAAYGCGAPAWDGKEQVYVLDLAVPTAVRLELTATTGNPDMILLSSCDPSRCLAPPADVLDLAGLSGTYYLVVDARAGEEGPYQLHVQCVNCPDADEVGCGTAFIEDLATGRAGLETYGCGSGYGGREIVHRLDASTTRDLAITLTELSGNPDLFVLDGCDPSQCVRLDSGTLTVSGGGANRYLVIDAEAGREGRYRLDIQCLGDDFAYCPGGVTFRGDPWGLDNGAWLIDDLIYPTSDTGSFALRVDGTTTYAHESSDCPELTLLARHAALPSGPAMVEWMAPEGRVRTDFIPQDTGSCCGLLVRMQVTNTDSVPHFYEFRAYHDCAFGTGNGTCTTGVVDGGPVVLRGVTHVMEADLLAAGGTGCDGQVLLFSAEDTTAPRAVLEMLPPSMPEVMEYVRYDDGGRPCSAWSGMVSGDTIGDCGKDSSILLAWRFPAGTGVLAPGESAVAAYRIGSRCEWPCAVTCDPPVLGTGAAEDPRPCNTGLVLAWDPATFPAGGHGAYHVYRSDVSFADALLRPPVSDPQGLFVTSFADPSSPGGVPLYYVVQAESTDLPGCGDGPLVGGSTAELQLGPVVDVDGGTGPATGVGSAVRTGKSGEDVTELAWPTARLLEPGESWVVLRAEGDPRLPFVRRTRTSSPAVSDAAPAQFGPVPHAWFYDVRVEDDCGFLSQE